MNVYSYENLTNTTLSISGYIILPYGEYVSNGTTILELDAENGGRLQKYLNGAIVVDNFNFGIPANWTGPDKLALFGVNGISMPVSGVLISSLLLPTGATTIADALPTLVANAKLMRAGARPPVVAIIGDSTTCGFSGNYTNNRKQQLAYTALKSAMAGTGFDVIDSTIFGSQNVEMASGTLPGWDSRVTFGGSWTSVTLDCLGKYALHLYDTNTGKASINFGTIFDTIEVYYATDFGSNGSFTVDINGETALADISCNQAKAFRKVVYKARPGVHTINFNRGASNGNIYLVGCIAYNSNKQEIILASMAWNGGRIADINQTANQWNYCHATEGLAVVEPSLTVLCMQINDWAGGTNVATFTTDTQAVITKAKTTGDVLLWQGVPSASGSASLATQAQFTAAYTTLAITNSLAVIDVYSYIGSYVVGNAAGLYADSLHLNNIGYSKIGYVIGKPIGVALAYP
jgi:hypothetical protein